MWHAGEIVNLLNLELRFKETQVVDISTMQSIEKVCDISALQCFEKFQLAIPRTGFPKDEGVRHLRFAEH
jgi:hypothetical protein